MRVKPIFWVRPSKATRRAGSYSGSLTVTVGSIPILVEGQEEN